ncbi:kinesin-like protein KIF25 isoform X3 [Sus scrofa]|uniref:kinesin-like protein KIF25 isoform X3 n=1 Tax=Sus scrofa TaxID=9823 RepID=UPI000A2B5144|nr:kinesin-like protein KIF25 isoform X3 [Sus scrofa]
MLRVACIVPTCSGNAGFVYLDLPCSHGPPDTWLPVGGLDTRLEFVPRKEGRCRSRSREVNSGPESVLGCMSRPALSRAVEKPLRDGIFLLQLRERSQWRFVQCTPRPAGSGSGRAGASLRPVGAVATLRGDLERLRSSALGLLGTFRAELQHCVAQVVAVAARTAQLHREAVQSAQPAERLERTLQEVAERWQRERRERRRLHDALVELRGNIRVHCRIRPLLPSDNECDDPAAEKSPVSGEVVHAVDDETVLVDCSRSGHPRINKTYTFERLISEDPSRSPGVQVSVVEVYNNGIFDLLASDGCGVTSGVKRRVLTTHEGQEVSGLTHESVHSAEEFMTLVGAGLQLRARQATAVHSDSSRSHLVVTLTLTRAASSHSTADTRSNQPLPQGLQRLDPQQPTLGRSPSVPRRASFVSPSPQALRRASEQVHAKLQLVDLAGSECAGVSGATGLALRETSSINRSLAALADVLGALSEGRGHVPYRNSRLTHLLQDALGGDAKLQVIVCVSPGQKHVAETLQSLGFGARARQVERGRPAPRKRR